MRWIILLIVAAMLWSGSLGPAEAQAGCYYNGQPYPPGSRVGGLVCINGQWVPG